MRRFVVGALVCVGLWSKAGAAVVVPSPGQVLQVLREEAVLVFDPLTGQQTTLIQHVFSGTAAPFGLIVPTPRPAAARTVPDRLMAALDSTLHPKAAVHRVLDLRVTSWVGSCALQEVGDIVPEGEQNTTASGSAGTTATLGTAPEPLHDWMLEHGFTLTPAQAIFLDEVRARGWSLTGVVVRPPSFDGPLPETLRGPVISLAHEAEEPAFAAGHPPEALVAERGPPAPPLEVAVLTEWPVALDASTSPEPSYLDAVEGRDVARIAAMGGEPRWSFRRDGTMTQFPIERPSGPGFLRFVRTAPRPPIKPAPEPITRVHRVGVPAEALLAVAAFLAWGWLRWGRRRADPPGRMTF